MKLTCLAASDVLSPLMWETGAASRSKSGLQNIDFLEEWQGSAVLSWDHHPEREEN
jgi:hypothetical protein